MNPIHEFRRRLETIDHQDSVTLTGREFRTLVEMADEGAQRGRLERSRDRAANKLNHKIEEALRNQLRQVFVLIFAMKGDMALGASTKDLFLGRTQASMKTLEDLRNAIMQKVWK
jgi:hypothetical protein